MPRPLVLTRCGPLTHPTSESLDGVLPGHSDGRLITVHHRLETSDRHDIRLVHEVVQNAVDLTGMTDVPWERRTRLLSDNGPGYISRSFGEYLRLVGFRHILASPFHPQTNGKLERYHRTIKLDVNQTPYDVLGNLELAITEFVNYYNNRRYHKVLGNVTPSDVLDGRREQILQKRKEVQAHTFQRRRLCNQCLRELAESAPNFH